ncbi:MAG: (d)CMP kinase [Lachnospiraceae bacterium]|nr:(d)CMP kinase [Lachnospiraceae bacterium]
MSFNVAIDGPAGAGKSTIAKQVARKMNLIYVDTGAMYRAIGLYFIRENISPDETDRIEEVCRKADVTIRYEKGEQIVCLNGENVNAWLRTEEVSRMSSRISVFPEVRAKLRQLQCRLAADEDVIMDGRDIGTCVLPDADVKIYLTASVEVRAKRRYEELQAKGTECSLEEIMKEIADRDHRDMTREESPLRQAEDAVLVDTSDMGIEEVAAEIIRICGEKRGWK